jgi:hypothetical protein
MKWVTLMMLLAQADAEECIGGACAESATMLQVQNRGHRKHVHAAGAQHTQTSALYEATVALLKKGATPAVISFTETTLEDIKGSLLPAIAREHDSDEASLATFFANFDAIATNYSTHASKVEADRNTINLHSAHHRECREALKAICDTYNREEDERESRWQTYKRKTDKFLKAVQGEGDTGGNSPLFCETTDSLYGVKVDVDGDDDQRGRYLDIVETGKERFEAWDRHEEQRLAVEARLKQRKEKEAECDADQTKLEEAACSAHDLHDLTKTFVMHQWDLALSNWRSESTRVKEREEARKAEMEALAEVQCLLGKIKEREGKPCDSEEDAAEAEAAIVDCQTKLAISEKIVKLTLNYPQPQARPTPPEDRSFPCTEEYQDDHYQGLDGDCYFLKPCVSSCAEACNGYTHCSGHGVAADGWQTSIMSCECMCTDGYSGEECEVPPPCDADAHCSSHGTTRDMDATDGCECSCVEDYVGDDCSIPPECKSEVHCSGHATLDRDRTNGCDCQCSGGWGGDDCSVPPGAHYVRWGHDSCPQGATKLYTGYAAGSHYGHGGSGANTICLHPDPTYVSQHSGNQNGALLYGTEYQNTGAVDSNHDQDAVCSVCAVQGATYTQWGRNVCPSGQRSEYSGYIMSTHYTQQKSTFVCVDQARMYTKRSLNTNHDGNLWYTTEFEAGSLPGGIFTHHAEAECAQCTMMDHSDDFVRWGHTECPAGATTLYSGFTAGSHYGHSGGGANTICLHPQPTMANQYSGDQNGALLYGTEYENTGSADLHHDHDAACTVCAVMGTSYTQWGRNVCPDGQKKEYSGYIMANHYTQYKSSFVCVDEERKFTSHSNTGNSNGNLWYTTEYELGALPGNVFSQDAEATCAQCTASDHAEVYIRWGHRECPDGATKFFTGYTAGSHYGHNGGGYNTLCLHPNPDLSFQHTGNQNGALLYGTEYENTGSVDQNHDQDAVCAVCGVQRGTTYTQWGRNVCPRGQRMEYKGYVMSTHYTQKKSTFVCVDEARMYTVNNGYHGGNHNGNLWYTTEYETGSLPGGVFTHDAEATCAQCTITSSEVLCPGTEVGGKCFFVLGGSMNYEQAKGACHDWYQGGAAIASVHSAAENNAVRSLVGGGSAYLGATRTCISASDCGAWVWDDGSSWWQPEPVHHDGLNSNGHSYNGGETHVVMHGDGKWHDWARGQDQKSVVCQFTG